MLLDSPCPQPELLLRSLDPDDPMTDNDRLGIETHVDNCRAGCREAIANLLRGHSLVGAALPTDDELGEAIGRGGLDVAYRARQKGLGQPMDGKVLHPSIEYVTELANGENDLETSTGDDSGSPTKSTFLSPPEQPDEIGRLGSYRVLELLGEGGMGFVYHAEDTMLHRAVALKVMRPEVAAKTTAKDRFLREGRAAAKLKNDHVVTIYFVGEANGVPYMALEFLEGKNLDDWLKDHPAPVAINVLLKVARDVLKGLASAHEKGLVHRDIKPANLWIEKGTNRVKVLDFGLTRDAGGADQVTQSGTVVGTPAYMAPEQAGGKAIDGRTDLFSIGVVLHRMISGASPFQRGEIYSTLTALALEDPDTLSSIEPSVPPAISDWVGKLLAKKPENRHASAKAALAELAAIENSLKNPTAAPTETLSPSVILENIPKSVAPVNVWAALDATASAAVPVESLPKSTSKPKPKKKTQQVKQAPKFNKKWIVGGLIGLALAIVAVVVVIIRDKDGKKIAEVVVPDGDTVEVKNDHEPKKEPVGVVSQVDGDYELSFDPLSHVYIPSLQIGLNEPVTIEGYITTSIPEKFENVPLFIFNVANIQAAKNWGARIYLKQNKTLTADSKVPIVSGRRTHIAGAFTEKELRIFVDGVPSAVLPVGSNVPTDQKAVFQMGFAYTGKITEVRVSKGTRYIEAFTPSKRFETDPNTLALYHFDEGQGDVLSDSSGNNHHGKIVGAKWVKVDGAIAPLPTSSENTLAFKKGDRATFESLKVDASSPFTLEGYVTVKNLNANTGQNFITAFRHSALILNSSKWVFGAWRSGGDGGKSFDRWSEQPIVVGKRTHIAGVYTGTQLVMFIDGKPEKPIELKLPLSGVNKNPFTLGGNNEDCDFEIGEIRFSKVARYTKEFTPSKRFEPDADTLALYHFDEGTGDILKDSSGNNRHGKIVGAKWIKVDSTPTVPSSGGATALSIGKGNWVTIDSLKLDVSVPFTLEGYLTPRNLRSQHFFISDKHCGLGLNIERWSFSVYRKQVGAEKESTIDLFSNQPVVVGKRVHVAGVYSGSQLLWFIDGKLDRQFEVKSTFVGVNPKDFSIGSRDPGMFNDFLIEEIRFSKAARYTKDFTPAKRFETDADTVALYHCDEGVGDILKDSSGNNHHGKIVGAKWMKADGSAIAPSPKTEFVPLFNGKDLNGWADKDGKAGNWKVLNSAITCSGSQDNLYSKRDDFGDFHIRAECMVSDGGNTGIFFRAGIPLPVTGTYKAQINSTHSDVQKTGGLYNLVKVTDMLVKPATWFTYDIVVQGNRIQLFVEGVKTADYTETLPGRPTKGHIVLQSMVPTPYFRKIEICELKPGDIAELPKPAGIRTFKSDEWIDVLEMIDPVADHASGGKWNKSNGALLNAKHDAPSKILFPLRYLEPRLEWEFDFTRTAGDETGLVIDLPHPDGLVPLWVGWHDGSGIHLGQFGDRSTNLAKDFRIVTNTRYKILIRLTRTGSDDLVDVFVDDKSVGQWKGNLATKAAPSKNKLFLTAERNGLSIAQNQEYTFHAIRVRMLDGATAESIRPIPSIGKAWETPVFQKWMKDRLSDKGFRVSLVKQ